MFRKSVSSVYKCQSVMYMLAMVMSLKCFVCILRSCIYVLMTCGVLMCATVVSDFRFRYYSHFVTGHIYSLQTYGIIFTRFLSFLCLSVLSSPCHSIYTQKAHGSLFLLSSCPPSRLISNLHQARSSNIRYNVCDEAATLFVFFVYADGDEVWYLWFSECGGEF